MVIYTTMERVNFDYSLKNIPIPGKNPYLKIMIQKLEKFIRRIRWKVFFFKRYPAEKEENTLSNFGFKSTKTPPSNMNLTCMKWFEILIFKLYQMISKSNWQVM